LQAKKKEDQAFIYFQNTFIVYLKIKCKVFRLNQNSNTFKLYK
jgi:hypothetical protein